MIKIIQVISVRNRSRSNFCSLLKSSLAIKAKGFLAIYICFFALLCPYSIEARTANIAEEFTIGHIGGKGSIGLEGSYAFSRVKTLVAFGYLHSSIFQSRIFLAAEGLLSFREWAVSLGYQMGCTLFDNRENIRFNFLFGPVGLLENTKKRSKSYTSFNAGVSSGVEFELMLSDRLDLVFVGGGLFSFLQKAKNGFSPYLGAGIKFNL